MSVLAPSREVHPSRFYLTLVGLGLVCAFVLAGVFELTKPVIEQKREEALKRAIFGLWPSAQRVTGYSYDRQRGFRPVARWSLAEDVVYAVYGPHDELAGFSILASGMGYQDRIAVIYAYDPALEVVMGMQVLDSRETPGLGDRIAHDASFLENFRSLDVSLGGDGMLQHALQLVKPGQKTQGWQIDGISGATVSSRAVVEIFQNSTQHWLGRLRQQRGDFTRGAQTD